MKLLIDEVQIVHDRALANEVWNLLGIKTAEEFRAWYAELREKASRLWEDQSTRIG